MMRKKRISGLAMASAVAVMIIFSGCVSTELETDEAGQKLESASAEVVVSAQIKSGEETPTDFQPETTAKDAQDQENKDTISQVTYWVNRRGEVYDSDYAPAGLDETFAAFLWLSTHEGEIIGENLPGDDYPCIAESKKLMEAVAEGEETWDMLGAVSQVWVRMEQEPFAASEGSFGQVGHKDYIIYREGEDACVGWQSVGDGDKWTVSRIAGYGDWLEKELGIFVRMTTGLGLQAE